MQKSLKKGQRNNILTANQLFNKFREKRRNIPDILLLYCEKKNIIIVTQRQMNSLKRRFNAAIKEVEDLLNEKGEIKEGNVGILLVCKENIEK